MQKLLLRFVLGMMIMMIGLISHAPLAIASTLETPQVTVYRSPSCSCCGNWLEHIQKHGFKISADIKTDDMDAVKQKYNLPLELASCHTAIIDGYVMEGHIPAEDIKHFLQQKPQLAGLAVPRMPIGSPGMESGNTQDSFNVMAFNHQGESQVFRKY